MSNMYFQCHLARTTFERSQAIVHQTKGWIAERGAKLHAEVELLTGDGEFWTVVDVYTPGMELSDLQAKQARDRGSLPSLVKA